MWCERKRVLLIATLAAVLLSCSGDAWAQAGVMSKTGTLPDGAKYLIEVPPNWNGALFLYSHGYEIPGSANPALDVGDLIRRFFMLSSGFRLAGSSYATTVWAVEQALPICGALSGGVATSNTALDSGFAFKNLIALGSGLQVVNIADPAANLQLSEEILAVARIAPQGRARLALVAALDNVPGWVTPLFPEPASDDFAPQEANQFLWDQQVDFPFLFAFRAELEARASGNPSWNTNVDYRRQLARSADATEVRALYVQAGLDLEADLTALNRAPRISPCRFSSWPVSASL